jgi:hypothetical protein
MNPELTQLKDIHLPPAISHWPLAPGWIVLLIVMVSALAYLGYVWYQRRLSKASVKFALLALQKLKAAPEDVNIAAEISTLIRRTALHYFQREDIAGLTGTDWLTFLNNSINTNEFTTATGRLLIDAPYRNNQNSDLVPLFSLTQTWLLALAKYHRPVEK